MNTASAIEFYQQEFNDATAKLPARNSTRVQRLRLAALARFTTLGFPGVRDEAWKYTRLTSFEKQQFKIVAKNEIKLGDAVLQALAKSHDLPGYTLVFIDGYYAPHVSAGDQLPDGISMISLGRALEQEDDVVMQALEQVNENLSNGFTALNMAYLSDGVSLRIAKNTVIPAPVNLVFINQGRENSGTYLRHLITLEPGSQASITETYIGLGDNSYFTNSQTEVMVGENARLDYYTLQQQGNKAVHVAGLNVVQQADSRFAYHCFLLGGQLARQDFKTVLAAEGAECLVNALLLGQGRQHIDLHTHVEHAVSHCASREYVRAILDERARGVLDGKVIVQPQAQKTDARLVSNNLLLSHHAEMDVKPQLEIYADDVKCGHAATVGQLDDNALFYLRSRGLDETTARTLMTYAFAADIIGRVPKGVLRDSFQQRVLTHMPQALHVRGLL
ncbi:MAG: Fe-S cluster assembly protein SufD [Gammaproteobacteria bacterium]|nr:Fe-S cluster assembly protein SufD [Gammaproteobacteria bacterium]